MCEVACSAFHSDSVSPALSRIRVAKVEEIGVDLAIACVGCEEKYCLECTVDALTVGDRGQIVVDRGECMGCEVCVDECPIGAVGFHEEQPLFCDLCGGTPACVEICPTDALVLRDGVEPSLEPFLKTRGGAARRRASYAKVVAEPLRERWMAGARLGP